MKAYAAIKDTDWRNKDQNKGFTDGYIVVNKDSEYFEKSHDEITDLIAHGGLVYSGELTDELFDQLNFINLDKNKLDKKEKWWVFGFRTDHPGDTLADWPEVKVAGEAMKLFKQVEEKNKIKAEAKLK